MTNRFFNEKSSKKDIIYDGKAVMAVNVKYPEFECSDGTKAEASFVEKINKFYSRTAEKYRDYVTDKSLKKASRLFLANGGIKTSFLLSCTVSLCTTETISVFCDVNFFDGTAKKSIRFSQNWSVSKSAILPSRYVFNKTASGTKYIKEIILQIAEKNTSGKDFSYFSDYRRIINKKFDFDNFYFVPSGVAFFFNGGTLSAEACPCVFVIPTEKIDGILKINTFMP